MELRPNLMMLLRGLFRRLDDLVERDPWLPVPQSGCCFAFGPEKRPLPVGALDILLHEDWPGHDRCPIVLGVAHALHLRGVREGGGEKSCCSAAAASTISSSGISKPS